MTLSSKLNVLALSIFTSFGEIMFASCVSSILQDYVSQPLAKLQAHKQISTALTISFQGMLRLATLRTLRTLLKYEIKHINAWLVIAIFLHRFLQLPTRVLGVRLCYREHPDTWQPTSNRESDRLL